MSEHDDLLAFVLRTMSQPSEPSRRSNRNKSGRSAQRLNNTRRTQSAVGGYADPMRAVYAPADQEMCVVMDREINAVGTFAGPVYQPPQGSDRGYQGRVGCV